MRGEGWVDRSSSGGLLGHEAEQCVHVRRGPSRGGALMMDLVDRRGRWMTHVHNIPSTHIDRSVGVGWLAGCRAVEGIYNDILEVVKDEEKAMREVRTARKQARRRRAGTRAVEIDGHGTDWLSLPPPSSSTVLLLLIRPQSR